jgi:hypothetical protein
VTKAYGDAAYLGASAGVADYIHATLSAEQTNPTTGDAVDFDTILSQKAGGDLALDTVTNVGRFSGLKAGRTYVLLTELRGNDTVAAAIQGQWYNVTGSANLGNNLIAYAPNYSTNITSAPVAFAIFTPTADTEVEVRLTVSGTVDVVVTSWAAIFEIGHQASFPVADFIHASLSSQQSNPDVDDPVEFDTVLAQKSGGDLELDTSSSVGRFLNLKAGRTYALIAGIRMVDDAAFVFEARWYNVTGSAYFGSKTVGYSASHTSYITDMMPGFAVFTPSVDTDVEVRISGTTTTADVRADSWAAIYELAGPQYGAEGETLINTIRAGDVASHNSATPLVVSQFAFDPSEYSLTGATRSLVFRAVAANGGGVAQTKARLYSVTDTEYIGSGLTFTSANPAKAQETLTIGTGSGEVDDSEKIYEVHIWVVSPDEVDDTIELGSAELRLVNTIS